jgi:glutamate carboxypeptidase
MPGAGLQDLRAAVEAALPDYLDDLHRLVDVDCGSYTKAGVDEVATWVARRLEELGASVVRHPNHDFGDTIVGTFEGLPGGPTVLLIGHTDTVFEPGTVAERPFAIRDGRAYGPGVSDMKAGLLTGLYAVAALRSVGAAGSPSGPPGGVGSWLSVGRLICIVNPDEEIGSPVSTPLIEVHAASADVALVLEAARENGDIVSARKGNMHVRIDVQGRAAHAGVEPEKGRSAVLEAAHKIVALHELNGRVPGVTVNVGAISGGTRPNIVPDAATLDVDVRAVQRADLEAVESAIATIVARSTVPDVDASVEVMSRHWPMERTDESGRLVAHAVRLAAQLGFSLHEAATGGASDGNTTAGVGVPTIDGLGPIGGLDHAPGEYIEVESIVPRTTLLAGLLAAIGEDPGIGRTTRHA